jgi:hypothetical protein
MRASSGSCPGIKPPLAQPAFQQGAVGHQIKAHQRLPGRPATLIAVRKWAAGSWQTVPLARKYVSLSASPGSGWIGLPILEDSPAPFHSAVLDEQGAAW